MSACVTKSASLSVAVLKFIGVYVVVDERETVYYNIDGSRMQSTAQKGGTSGSQVTLTADRLVERIEAVQGQFARALFDLSAYCRCLGEMTRTN